MKTLRISVRSGLSVGQWFRPGEQGKRPLFLRAVGPLYTYFFPLILTIFVGFKLVTEAFPPKQITDWFDIVIGVVIVLYNVFYVVWVTRQK